MLLDAQHLVQHEAEFTEGYLVLGHAVALDWSYQPTASAQAMQRSEYGSACRRRASIGWPQELQCP